MAEVKFKKGLAHAGVNRTAGGRNSIETLKDAMAEQAKCGCAGQDCCYGYETMLHAETGDLLIRYYTGTTAAPVVVVEPFDIGLPKVKALYNART